MTRDPAVSVVVATRDRQDRVLRLLDALATQHDAPAFEVVVVDDGSSDGTADVVRARVPAVPYPLRVLRQERSSGPAGARNLGWRESRGGLILFTDDDCVPTPGWITSLARALDEADVVAGVTTYPPEQGDTRGTWSYWMEDDGRTGNYSTSNVGYRRAALEKVGGFDAEGFGSASPAARCINGEDTDLAWRVIGAGFRAEVAPGAVVHHDVFPSSWPQYVRNIPRLEGLVLLVKKHPHLRAHFGREWVWSTEHAAVIALGVGLAGLSSRRLRPVAALGSVAAAAWYVRLFRRFRRPPDRPAGYLVAVPLGVVADGYGALVMLRASIRYRTLLL